MYPNLAEQYEWGITDYLLANLIDLTAAANWQRENAGLTKEQRPSPRPKPMYRPGVSSSRKTMEQREIEWAARKRKHEAEREQSGSN